MKRARANVKNFDVRQEQRKRQRKMMSTVRSACDAWHDKLGVDKPKKKQSQWNQTMHAAIRSQFHIKQKPPFENIFCYQR